jgi:hypothetical protein
MTGYFAELAAAAGSAWRSFSAALRALHQTTVDCFANAMPFAELARALGDAGRRGNQFSKCVSRCKTIGPPGRLPGLSAKLRMRSTGTPAFTCLRKSRRRSNSVVWLFRPKLFPGGRGLGASSRVLLAAPAARPKPASPPDRRTIMNATLTIETSIEPHAPLDQPRAFPCRVLLFLTQASLFRRVSRKLLARRAVI